MQDDVGRLADVLRDVAQQRTDAEDDALWVARMTDKMLDAFRRDDYRRALSLASSLSSVARNVAIRLESAAAREAGAYAMVEPEPAPEGEPDFGSNRRRVAAARWVNAPAGFVRAGRELKR